MKKILNFKMYTERMSKYSLDDFEDVVLANFKKAAKEINLNIQIEDKYIVKIKDDSKKSIEVSWDVRVVNADYEDYENVKKELEHYFK
jgi:hypothetical protein